MIPERGYTRQDCREQPGGIRNHLELSVTSTSDLAGNFERHGNLTHDCLFLAGANGGAYGQNGAHYGAPPAADGEQLLQEAMQADARGAARRNAKDPFAALGVKFVEVRGPHTCHHARELLSRESNICCIKQL